MSKAKRLLYCFLVFSAALMPSCRMQSAFAYDPTAKQVKTSTANFNNNLSSADSDVQKALDTLDNLSISGSSLSVVTKTANYTLTSANDVVLGDTSGGVFTLTLPTAVGVTKAFVIKRIGSGSNNLTIATTSSQTIDGSTSLDLIVTNTSITIVSDNANWRIR